MSETRFACRSCGATQIAPIIDLGTTPLANRLLTGASAARDEPRYPLNAVLCEACGLVQITETVPPSVLFEEYVYFSSVSDTTVAAARDLATRLARERKLGPDALVMEAASNDGYLLNHYRALGVRVLGIEPARNVAQVAEAAGVPTRVAFFGRDEAARLAAEGQRADVFHANNVLAHVADLNGFVAGIAMVLKPSGLASIEAPYVRDLVEKLEFDTIYHEHLCYFSATAIERLFARHGLALIDAEHLPIHGGSLRYFGAPAPATRTDRLDALLADEGARGIAHASYYAAFATRVAALCQTLRSTLARLKRDGATIAAYGASAKGTTLLHYCGIGGETLDFVVDRSPVKQGCLTPGTHLPIVAPAALLERRPDYVLLLTWNFAEEILAQQQAYRAAGGKFIVPLPEVRIV
jgi:SAM-dependent methyltransferase